jgi:hypothetical protein
LPSENICDVGIAVSARAAALGLSRAAHLNFFVAVALLPGLPSLGCVGAKASSAVTGTRTSSASAPVIHAM